MSEIVRVSASGTVGIVRATYINHDTGEELLEVQPVGRTHRNVYVTRKETELATRDELDAEMARVSLITLREVHKSAGDRCGSVALLTIEYAIEALELLESDKICKS